MKTSTPDPITALTAALAPVEPTDTISLAGRKIIRADAIRLLALRDGAVLGEDPEFVHDMRVATRRMRSALRLLKPYYRRKTIKRLMKPLRWLARLLGAVRDLDVLLADLSGRQSEALAPIVEDVTRRREKAQRKLSDALAGAQFADLIDRLTAFALDSDDPLADSVPLPVEVRHVVPVLLHQQLAVVRGFDPLFDDGAYPDFKTLHGLRIAFKQLRYATAYFNDVLGSSADAFVSEIKAVQDHLGRLSDVVAFDARLASQADAAPDDPALGDVISQLKAEADTLVASFVAAWSRFNSRAVQKHLADALLVLR